MNPIGVPFVTVYSKDFSLDGFILIQVCQKHNTPKGGREKIFCHPKRTKKILITITAALEILVYF